MSPHFLLEKRGRSAEKSVLYLHFTVPWLSLPVHDSRANSSLLINDTLHRLLMVTLSSSCIFVCDKIFLFFSDFSLSLKSRFKASVYLFLASSVFLTRPKSFLFLLIPLPFVDYPELCWRLVRVFFQVLQAKIEHDRVLTRKSPKESWRRKHSRLFTNFSKRSAKGNGPTIDCSKVYQKSK